jgi:hypothetical protein
MRYQEAMDKLAAYLEVEYTRMEPDWADLLDTAFQALGDCLKVGLAGDEGEEPDVRA